LKRTTLSFLLITLLLGACRKNNQLIIQEAALCKEQTANPTGSTYTNAQFISVDYRDKNCGLMPLSKNSYWVYQDSIFSQGTFVSVKNDTLRFNKTYMSQPDGLIWWEPNQEIGLPAQMYVSDSSIYIADFRLFATDPIRDAKQEYGLFAGDSIGYLASFDDNAALGKSLKLTTQVVTPAGSFSDCIMYEKKSPYSRRDQMFFKPGLGVAKYTYELFDFNTMQWQPEKKSTLISFHLD
jgi:hypothetical protein